MALGDVRQPDRRGARVRRNLPATATRCAGGLVSGTFDAPGAVLATGGMLLLVTRWSRPSTVGRGTTPRSPSSQARSPCGRLRGRRDAPPQPARPLSIFRINGLGLSDVTQLVAFAGFLAVSSTSRSTCRPCSGTPRSDRAAYLPLCFVVGIGAGISSQLLTESGHADDRGQCAGLRRRHVDRCHGFRSMAVYLRPAARHAGAVVRSGTDVVRGDDRCQCRRARRQGGAGGIAAQRLTTSRRALGLAIFTAIATSRTQNLLAADTPVTHALTAGFQRALVIGSILISPPL